MSTPYLAGSNTAASGASLAVTAGSNAGGGGTATGLAAGDTAVLAASAVGGASPNGATDSNSETFTAGPADTTSPASGLWYALGSAGLASGTGTATAAYSGSSGAKNAVLIGVPSVSAADTAAAASGAGTVASGALSLTSGALAQQGETLIGMITYGSTGGGSVTWGTGWTPLCVPFRTGSNEWTAVACYSAGASTAAVTMTVSGLSGTPAWTAAILPFKPALITASAVQAIVPAQSASAKIQHHSTAAQAIVPMQSATASVGPTLAVAGQWGNSYAASEAFALPVPGITSLPIAVTNTAGHWLFAIITWLQPTAGDGVTVTVADDAHNWWEPAGAPNCDSASDGATRTAIWAAPAARVANSETGVTNVMVAPTGFVTALAALVVDLEGLLPWMDVTGVLPDYASDATSLMLPLAAPGATAVLLTAAGTDNNTATITGPGTGWTALDTVTASNGTDHTADLQLNAAWQATSGAASAAWSSGATVLDFSGVIAAFLVSGTPPTQPSPGWPAVITETAAGSGQATPPSEIGWSDASAWQRAFSITQGRQYTLGQLQAGQGTVTLDNQGGTWIPPGTGDFAGIDSGTPLRVRLINPAALCPHNVIFNGVFQRFPPAWDSVMRGVTQATIADVWAYANATLPTILRAEILNDAPYAYWPLSDAAGSMQASNLAGGGSGMPLSVVISKNGSSGSVQEFGANSGALAGDTTVTVFTSGQSSSSTGMWEQTLAGASLTTNGNGLTLQCQDSDFPPVGDGVTIETWFQSLNGSPDWSPTIWIIKDGRGASLALSMNQSTGYLQLTWWNTNGVGQSVITVSANDFRLYGYLVHIAVAVTQTTWAVYVNGGGTSATSGTFGGSGLRPSFSLISFNGQADRYATGDMFSGYLAHAAIYPAALPKVRILTHWFAGWYAITDDSASGRIERLLQAASVTGRRCILPETPPDVDRTTSCSDIGGQPAATSLTNIASSAIPAMLAVAPTGDIFYLAKQYAWNQPIRWVLGTSAAAGEIPFLPLTAGGGLDYDPSRVVDDIQLTHLDRQDVILPTGAAAAQAQASQLQYGDITYWQTGYLDGDATQPYTYGPGLYDLANWLAEVYGKPGLRAASIGVECFANSANGAVSPVLAWEFYGAVAVGDMVTLNVRPATDAPLVITVTGRITQTARRLSFGEDGTVTARITLAIDTAPEEYALTCDDTARGQLNGQNVLAW